MEKSEPAPAKAEAEPAKPKLIAKAGEVIGSVKNNNLTAECVLIDDWFNSANGPVSQPMYRYRVKFHERIIHVEPKYTGGESYISMDISGWIVTLGDSEGNTADIRIIDWLDSSSAGKFNGVEWSADPSEGPLFTQ